MIFDFFNEKTNIEKYLNVTETLFLCLIGVILARFTLLATMFTFDIPAWFDNLLSLIISIIVVARIIPQYKNKFIWMAVIVNVIYSFSWDVDFFPMIAILTVGCVGINYRKILKVYLISVSSIIICAIISSISGVIPNLVYLKDGYIRSSMGIIYPTDFASIVFFVMIALWVYFDRLNSFLSFVFPIASFAVAYLLARSSTCTVSSVIFVIVIIYLIIENRFVNRIRCFRWIKRAVDIILIAAFPILGFGMFFLTWDYYKGYTLGAVLNNYVTHRFVYAIRAFRENDITAFGGPIAQYGAGGITYDPLNYYFIDCSYLRILIMYGVVICILICALWVFLSYRMIKTGKRKIAFALALIALHALSEHHFIHICYNIFLIMPFVSLNEPETVEEDISITKYRRIYRVVSVFVILFTIFVAISQVSKIRMVSNYIDNQFIMFLVYIISGSLILSFGLGLSHIITSKFLKLDIKKRHFYTIILTSAILSVLVLISARVYLHSMTEFSYMLDYDSAALDTIMSVAKGDVYVDKFCELFRSKYKGIQRSILDGENLARYSNTSVVVDKYLDSPIFIDSGFMYTEISDCDAVYTNDVSVIDALKEAGYKVTAYCSSTSSADLEADARVQGLEIDDNGSVFLKGKKRVYHLGTGDNPFSIDEKRIINLHKGKYALNYDLQIEPVPYENDYVVCRVLLSAYGGEKGIRDVIVYRSMFDDDGYLRKSIIFKTGNYQLIQSYLIMEEGQEGILEGVSWQRFPNYDIHYAYNDKHQKIEKRFFDREGNPTLTDMGYACIRLTYDFQGMPINLKFYGLDDQLTDISLGYAEIRRTYNIKRQKIKEEYFNTRGEQVSLNDGYYAKEWEYDAEGMPVILKLVDKKGERTNTVFGFSEIHRKYEIDKHRVIEESYFNTEGEKVNLKEGYFGIRREYTYDNSDDGNKDNDILVSSVKRYIDVDDNPVEDIDGIAEVKLLYNDEEKEICEEYCDISERDVNLGSGYCMRETTYDLEGNERSYRYCDKAGDSVLTGEGYAEIIMEYDELERLIKVYYLDEDKRPVQTNKGYASLECFYDKSGKLVSQRFFDLNGEFVKEAIGYDMLEIDNNRIGKLWWDPFENL